jgi:YD repeat-containing protein
MKKVTIALLLATVFSCVQISCNKVPFPHKKTCQIKSIQYNYRGNHTELDYSYNNKRLLTSIAGVRNITTVTYDNQGRYAGGTNFNNTNYKLIYENGRVTRIDYLGTDNLYHTQFTFVYDSLSRIIERVSADGSTLIWQYEGTSPNFTRMFELYLMRAGEPPELFAMHTYEYDDKTNPWSTWPGISLNPYYFELIRGHTWQYMPIPKNNFTKYTLYYTLRGIPLKSDEFFYTYQYDNEYPVQQDFIRVVHNPFTGSEDSTRGVNYYTYECVGGGKQNGK